MYEIENAICEKSDIHEIVSELQVSVSTCDCEYPTVVEQFIIDNIHMFSASDIYNILLTDVNCNLVRNILLSGIVTVETIEQFHYMSESSTFRSEHMVKRYVKILRLDEISNLYKSE